MRECARDFSHLDTCVMVEQTRQREEGGARPERLRMLVICTSAVSGIGMWACSKKTRAHELAAAKECAGAENPSAKPGKDGQVGGAVNAGVEPIARASAACISSLMAQWCAPCRRQQAGRRESSLASRTP